VRTRTALGRRWRAEAVAPVAVIAKVLRVSRQSLYDTPVKPGGPRPARPRSTPPPLPEGWQQLTLSVDTVTLEEALHVLARRHPAAGYRKVCSRARRGGFVVNRKKVARLLREWGFTRRAPRPHPKAQGRPFNVIAPNVLWQTDMTSVWCGEDGWAYFTAVIDCFDRSILGWTFTQRCRAKDLAPALEQAWATAWPHGPQPGEKLVVVCRHDNGTQFTSNHYRDVARGLGVKLSRTAYRHPDGNAFIERLYRTLKEECVWPNDFTSYDQALDAITAWVIDYNTARPHDSLGKDTTPAEARAGALDQHKTAA
jgi:putative transposase